MKFEITPKKNPNQVGEILRDHFFDQSEGLGCYETFKVKDGILALPNLPVEEDILVDDDGQEWIRYFDQEQKIEMRFYWDGDGTLVFIFTDGSCLANTDCKKNNRWVYYKDNDEFLGENKPL